MSAATNHKSAALTAIAPSAPDKEAAYTRAIEKRAQEVLDVLKLADAEKAARVRKTIVAQYRSLNAWHEANDARLKELSEAASGRDPAAADAAREHVRALKATLKERHDGFVAVLYAELTPEQVEQVKDKMTYNVVPITYAAYGRMLPGLTDGQKATILATLKEAREEAMDGGSADEKHAIFGRYKGRINNYLAAQGYDLKRASKDWAERERAAKAAATGPATRQAD